MSQIDDFINALAGKLTSQDMADVVDKLSALSRIKTQEDFDEGARLHAQKNAPWISGPYTHLGDAVLHPPYVYRPYPKALYHPDYLDARKALDDAHALPAHGTDDAERKRAVYLAEKWLEQTTKKVNDAEEHNRFRGSWFESPQEAADAKAAAQHDKFVQAAHLAHEDRRLIGTAKAERELADELVEDHLTDVTAVLKEKKPKRQGAMV